MKYALITFGGWVLSHIETLNSILQAITLTISLVIGIVGLYKSLKKKVK